MFRDVSLPHDVAFGATSGPEFATDVFTSPGGWEARRGHWPQNRGRWELSFLNKTSPEIAPLLAFFRAVAVGRAYSFRFRDFTDYQLADQIGIGDGNATTFQLVKGYHSGTASFQRVITKPDPASLRVFLNGIATDAFSVDGVTGLLTFTTAPSSGAAIVVTGEFDCMVRFDQDTLEFTAVDPGPSGVGVFSIANLALVEVVNEEAEPTFAWQPSYRETFDYVMTFPPSALPSMQPLGPEFWEMPYGGAWETTANPYYPLWVARINQIDATSGPIVGRLPAIQGSNSLQIFRAIRASALEIRLDLIPTTRPKYEASATSPFAIDIQTLLRMDAPISIVIESGTHWIGLVWLVTSSATVSDRMYGFFLESVVNTGAVSGWRYGYFMGSNIGAITQSNFVTEETGAITITPSSVIALRVQARTTHQPYSFAIHDIFLREGSSFTEMPLLFQRRTRLGNRDWIGPPSTDSRAYFTSLAVGRGALIVNYDATSFVGYANVAEGAYDPSWYGYSYQMYSLQDQWTPLVGTGSLLLRLNFTRTPGRQNGYMIRRSPATGFPDYATPHPFEDGRQRALWQVRTSVGTGVAHFGLFCLGQGVSTARDWAAVGMLIEFDQTSNTYTRVLIVQWDNFETDFTILGETPWSGTLTQLLAMELEWHRTAEAMPLLLIAKLGSTAGYTDLVPVLTVEITNPLPFPSQGEGPVAFFPYDGSPTAALDVSLDQLELDGFIQLAL